MKKSKIYLTVIVSLFVFIGWACNKYNDSGYQYGNQGTRDTTVIDVQLTTNAKFGSIITDGQGRSLYFFGDDANGMSSCTNGCLAVWPVFYKENPSVGTGLSKSDFSSITRPDGTNQTTYKGW